MKRFTAKISSIYYNHMGFQGLIWSPVIINTLQSIFHSWSGKTLCKIHILLSLQNLLKPFGLQFFLLSLYQLIKPLKAL